MNGMSMIGARIGLVLFDDWSGDWSSGAGPMTGHGVLRIGGVLSSRV